MLICHPHILGEVPVHILFQFIIVLCSYNYILRVIYIIYSLLDRCFLNILLVCGLSFLSFLLEISFSMCGTLWISHSVPLTLPVFVSNTVLF